MAVRKKAKLRVVRIWPTKYGTGYVHKMLNYFRKKLFDHKKLVKKKELELT